MLVIDLIGSSIPAALDAVSIGVPGRVDPVLLQQQQDGNLLQQLLPVILFMIFAIFPSLAQARKKARERQAAGSRPPHRGAGASEDAAGDPPVSSSTPSATDLEVRVKKYFEELVGPVQSEPPPPPPPVRPAHSTSRPGGLATSRSQDLGRGHMHPAKPDTPVSLLSDTHVDMEDAHVQLKGLGNREKLPSRQKSRGIQRRSLSDTSQPTSKIRTRHPLFRGRSIKDAIVLREVLGPPKAMDEF